MAAEEEGAVMEDTSIAALLLTAETAEEDPEVSSTVGALTVHAPSDAQARNVASLFMKLPKRNYIPTVTLAVAPAEAAIPASATEEDEEASIMAAEEASIIASMEDDESIITAASDEV